MNRDQKQCGCNSNSNSNSIKNLNINIKWQRLVAKGETCPRCESTEQELNKAINKLQQALSPLEIKVTLEKEEINISEFKQDPLQSNRILINEQPIESLLKGKVGQSPCCEVCGPTDCRTMEIDGQIYETIPSELIIQAGLMAANEILNTKRTNSCC
jgi:hypothetical protein